ncbi:hypothetical protein Ciccas_012054 [Cichlidogyrus casuarinus]|uniref:EF-hand domain-containing protein n=1 Tax=Cichlidogyrus casuarinus TaxID=1844966 RepID=A0ABD2PSJ1_9PLAT
MDQKTKQKLVLKFYEADADGNGYLTNHEIFMLIEKISGMVPPQDLETLRSKFDLNNDDKMTLGEFKVALDCGDEAVEEWKILFDQIDVDSNQFITVQELQDALTTWGHGDLQSVVEPWVRDYDANNDGKLSFREFLGFVAENII